MIKKSKSVRILAYAICPIVVNGVGAYWIFKIGKFNIILFLISLFISYSSLLLSSKICKLKIKNKFVDRLFKNIWTSVIFSGVAMFFSDHFKDSSLIMVYFNSVVGIVTILDGYRRGSAPNK